MNIICFVGSTKWFTGCTCSNSQGAYGGPVTPTQTPPYYNSSCQQFVSCQALLSQTALPAPFGTTSGVYNIAYSSGVVYPTYCDQTTNGGGWELILKISSSGSMMWSYSATTW